MTESGEGYDNQITERINGILKTEFNLDQIYKSLIDELLAVKQSINAYNNFRPHVSCDFLTPAEAHTTDQVLVKRWRIAVKVRQKQKSKLLFINNKNCRIKFDLKCYFVLNQLLNNL